MPNHYLALLRGINVGGKNRVPMKELAALMQAEGCSGVRTYIQSGNVLFDATSKQVDELAETLPHRISTSFGCSVPVVFRTADDLERTLRANPFLAEGAAEETLHVAFLRDAPTAEQISGLDPNRSPKDRFAVVGREIYLHLPAGVADSRLTNAYFDSKLKTVSTARNWRTVKTLYEMMRSTP